MKMNHLSKEEVEEIMEWVRKVADTQDYSPDNMEKLFELSKVDGNRFLECKEFPQQAENVKFEIDKEQGVRFFDPFNFFTGGIYKDVDGWSRWTIENLKEPWT